MSSLSKLTFQIFELYVGPSPGDLEHLWLITSMLHTFQGKSGDKQEQELHLVFDFLGHKHKQNMACGPAPITVRHVKKK